MKPPTSQSQNAKPVSGMTPAAGQSRFRFEPEMDLAAAITAHLGRDLFAGVTYVAERKARARIALVVDKLEGVSHGGQTLGALFTAIYGEPVRLPATIEQPVPRTKRKGIPA